MFRDPCDYVEPVVMDGAQVKDPPRPTPTPTPTPPPPPPPGG